MTRVVTYLRVSTEEQAKHYSIDGQRKVLADYAEGHNMTILREFAESHSASKGGVRPVFREMLEYVQRNRVSIDGILCYKIDRIARNLKDFAEASEMEGIKLISATESLPEGSTGTMIAGVQAVFARHASEVSSECIRLGMKTKAEKGLWPSTAPLGYSNDPGSKGIVPDPATADKIAALFEAYATGKCSLSDAASLAQDLGLRGKRGGRLTRSQVYGILKNPLYHGDFVWKEMKYHGKHEPLVSRGLFDRVQERLSGKSSSRESRSFPYRGLLTCGHCGCRITAERHAKGNKEYIYYRCTNGRGKCQQPYTRQQSLGERLGEIVTAISLTEEQVRFLLRMLEQDGEDRRKQREQRLRDLSKKRESLEHRRDGAYADKLDGKIDEARWLKLDAGWELDIAKVSDQIGLLEAVTEPQLDKATAAFELLNRMPGLYMEQNDEERARLLETVVSNCTITAEKLVPDYKKPFDLVAEGLRSGDWYPRQDSNL